MNGAKTLAMRSKKILDAIADKDMTSNDIVKLLNEKSPCNTYRAINHLIDSHQIHCIGTVPAKTCRIRVYRIGDGANVFTDLPNQAIAQRIAPAKQEWWSGLLACRMEPRAA